jgi:shikimate kinase
LRPTVLIGLPGSGKSTVGRELSSRSGWKLIDLDDEITKSAGQTIAQIFTIEGEDKFRTRETAELQRVFDSLVQTSSGDTETGQGSRHIVISTGGGLVERETNWELLKKYSLTVYLEVPIAVGAARIWNDEVRSSEAGSATAAIKRPLFKGASNEADIQKRLEELLRRREKFYRLADKVVRCEDRPIEEIAAEVERLAQGVGKIFGQ